MIGRRSFLRAGATGLAAAACSAHPMSARLWAQSAGLVRVQGAYSAPGLAYASLHLANQKQLWKQNGLETSLKHVEGGSLALVTLTTNDAEFICVAANDLIVAWDRGLKVQVIAAFYGALTVQFAARREWMEQAGVTPNSPVAQKIGALKNARIGAATVGGGPAQYTKYLGGIFGLDPQRDVKIFSVGQGPARIAALREGRVDLIVGGPPEADEIALQGFGDLFLNLSTEIPIFRDFPFTVVAVTQEFASQQPDKVRRIAQSIGQANDLVHSNFGEAVDALKAAFPRLNPKAVERTMERDREAFSRGGRMSETMWANAFKVAGAMKMVTNLPPVAEGQFWTNRFLG